MQNYAPSVQDFQLLHTSVRLSSLHFSSSAGRRQGDEIKKETADWNFTPNEIYALSVHSGLVKAKALVRIEPTNKGFADFRGECG